MRLKNSLPIILAAFIGVVVAFGVGCLSVVSEQRFLRLQLSHRVADEVASLNHELTDGFGALDMLRVFFEASARPISRAEFQHVSAPVRRHAHGLQLVGWAPRVTLADREDFERAQRDSGLAGFEIRDRSDRGDIERAPDRPVYYPLLYEEATTGAAYLVMGRDLRSNPARISAIGKATATNLAAATPPYPMHAPGHPIGLIAYVPVFRSAAETPKMIAQPDGMVFGIYDLAKMLDGVIREQHLLTDLDTYVFDPAGLPGHRLLYWRASDGRTETPPEEAALRQRPYLDARLRLLDQTLGVLVLPAGGLADGTWSWKVVEPSAVILFLTAIVTTYLVFSMQRVEQLNAMAETLRDTNAGLRSKAATIAHMARHDGLTGLPNRGFFKETLEHSLAARVPCAIIQVGLDRFKAVNEFHGHGVGDTVLREVAKRLRAVTRSDAVVARLGGDEFAVMADDAGGGQGAAAIARRLIEAIRQPVETSYGCVAVGATIGFAVFPADGTDAEKLLRAADIAMDTAKRRDRGSLCQFEPGMDEEVRSRLALEADLRRAIADGDIKPYYQPVVRLRDAALVGFEILARWHHPQRGLVTPDAFIGLAESTGLIADMTYSLLRRAAMDARTWPAHLYLALNISPLHLQKNELPEKILAILDQTGFAATRLEVEITESALVSSMEAAKASLLTLQQAGVRVALDDFGTGYSSLVHLRQLPLNKVKIDRSFVSPLLEDRENGKIVAAIVGLGKSLGIATTAEGIETKEVAVSLAGLGCDFGQGYFFAKPMTAEAAEAFYGLARQPARLKMSG